MGLADGVIIVFFLHFRATAVVYRSLRHEFKSDSVNIKADSIDVCSDLHSVASLKSRADPMLIVMPAVLSQFRFVMCL